MYEVKGPDYLGELWALDGPVIGAENCWSVGHKMSVIVMKSQKRDQKKPPQARSQPWHICQVNFEAQKAFRPPALLVDSTP